MRAGDVSAGETTGPSTYASRTAGGFPTGLPDAELEQKAAELGEALRMAAGDGLNVVLMYGELHEPARGDLFRRGLRRSERLSRRALRVAIAASAVTSLLAVAFVVIAARDESADRVVEVRDRLPADAGARELELLESIRAQLDEQAQASEEAAATLDAIRRELRGASAP